MSRFIIKLLNPVAKCALNALAGVQKIVAKRLGVALTSAVFCAAGLLPAVAQASSQGTLTAKPGPVNATVQISIVIPSILQILQNSHPNALQMTTDASGRTSASQHLVLLSTLRSGFCMDLQLAPAQVEQWKMRLSGNANVRVEEVAGGYRLCTRRPGRYELALEHEFVLKRPATLMAKADAQLDWPVNVSLATP